MSPATQHTTNDPARVEYWKSLLRIEAELAVVLADEKMPVAKILQLVPGVMIPFEKTCEAPLTIEVDGIAIAQGEVVKVGDKFGLRIQEILDRDERWIPLISTNAETGAKSVSPGTIVNKTT